MVLLNKKSTTYPSYKMSKLEVYKSSVLHAIEHKFYHQLKSELEKIGKLQTLEARKYLVDCIDNKHWKAPKKQVSEAICNGLSYFRDKATLHLILQAIDDKKIKKEDAEESLFRMTNVKKESILGYGNSFTDMYRNFITAQPTFSKMREFGYTRKFGLK